jgi:PST family polysaccharide transporter
MPNWRPDKALLLNVALVYVLQGSNFLLGFIAAPYLSRALGVEGYGAYAYCVSANTFVWILIDWGYGVGAVREIAITRNDPAELRRSFWRAVSGRMVMALPALGLLVALAVLNRANPPWVVLVSGLLNMAGAVIACDWFVMGVERMGVYLVTSVGARAATLALILVFVHQPGDAGAAGIISGLGGAFAGAAGWIAVTRLYPMGRPSLDWRRGLEQVWDFRHYFISRSNALLYASAAPVLLGLAASPAALGVYAGADRIVRVCIMVVTPLSIALAARVNAAMAASRRAAGAISGRVVLVYLALTIPMSVLLLLFAEHIAVLVLGEHFRSAGGIIRLLAPLPVLMALSSSLASQFLVPLGRARSLSRVTLVSSFLYLVALVALGVLAGAAGAAVSYVLAEICLVAGFSLVLLRHDRSYLALAFGHALRPTRAGAPDGP